MARYAVVENSTVTNVIVGPDGFTLDGLDLIALGPREGAAPGWTYDGNQFTAPGAAAPGTPEAPTTPSAPSVDELLTMIQDLQARSQSLQDQSDQLTMLVGGLL